MASIETIPDIKQLQDYASAMRLVTYFNIAAAAMLWYDYFLTLGREVDLVWPSKWGPMKVLFFVQRYLPFVDAATLSLIHQLSTTITPSACKMVEDIQGLLTVTGFCLSEIILTLRVWAVWKRNKYLGIALSIFLLATAAACYLFVGLFEHGLELSKRPYPEFQGCFIMGSNRLLYGNWLVLMVYDAVLLFLMVIPGITAYQEGWNEGLHTVVYRDGVLFYVYLFVLSTTNVIVIKALPERYLYILSSVERCVHSVLTSRVILHMRDHMRNIVPQWSDGVTEIQFASGLEEDN